MKSEGALPEKIPDGYEIYENPNAQVFLRRVQPQLIHDAEKAIVEKHLGKLKRSYRYMSDVKGRVITIFESVQDVGLLEELFDWKFEDVPPDKDYTIINVGEGAGGGIMKGAMPPDARPQWVPYILVDDIEASTEKAKSLGATPLIDIMDVPDRGRFSMFLDPTGAAFAMWEPKMPT